MQHYFIDATLLNSQLILLSKFSIDPLPEELQENRNITVGLDLGEASRIEQFADCHIDNTDNRRLRLPAEVLIWIRNTFPFSVAYFAGHYGQRAGIWKKSDVGVFFAAIAGKKKMDIPGETLLLSWETCGSGAPYLKISRGFQLTNENALHFLSEKALASVLPYIMASVQNTSVSLPKTEREGKKCYIIDQTTDWLSVAEYSKTAFSHPGLYLLRRKTDSGEYAYYIGKAADIKNRIVVNRNKVTHPDEKYESNKQYDEIACISVVFDDFKRLYGSLSDDTATPQMNPGVSRGSDTDNALYAVEDIAIHVVAMILKSEGKKLDNRQYRNYTSQQIRKLTHD